MRDCVPLVIRDDNCEPVAIRLSAFPASSLFRGSWELWECVPVTGDVPAPSPFSGHPATAGPGHSVAPGLGWAWACVEQLVPRGTLAQPLPRTSWVLGACPCREAPCSLLSPPWVLPAELRAPAPNIHLTEKATDSDLLRSGVRSSEDFLNV